MEYGNYGRFFWGVTTGNFVGVIFEIGYDIVEDEQILKITLIHCAGNCA